MEHILCQCPAFIRAGTVNFLEHTVNDLTFLKPRQCPALTRDRTTYFQEGLTYPTGISWRKLRNYVKNLEFRLETITAMRRLTKSRNNQSCFSYGSWDIKESWSIWIVTYCSKLLGLSKYKTNMMTGALTVQSGIRAHRNNWQLPMAMSGLYRQDDTHTFYANIRPLPQPGPHIRSETITWMRKLTNFWISKSVSYIIFGTLGNREHYEI